MTRNKEILYTIAEILLLISLLFLLSKGGLAVFVGSAMAEIMKVIIQFGVFIMTLFGILVGTFLPTRRHRIYRDTQVHSVKYLIILLLYQMMMLFVGSIIGSMDTSLVSRIPPMLSQIVGMTFAMIALMMPFNFVKNLFTYIKSVEFRDPRDIIRQLFG